MPSRFIRDAGRTRAESTVREYRRRLDAHVLPKIGGTKLRALTAVDVERLLNGMAQDGLGKSTIVGARNALSAMLSEAVLARHLRANVAKQARLPRVAPPAKKATATAEQVMALLEAAEETDLAELLVVIALTGCRIGEALGARWSDFDLDAGVWVVSRTASLDGEGHVVVRDRTKTGEPRAVEIKPAVVQALTSQRAKVAAARLKAGPHWRDHDPVFPTSVGTPQDSRNLRKEMRRLGKESGYPASFHNLRHFFATVAASQVPLASLAKVLGHRRIATTADVYGHLYDRDAARAADAVADALTPKRRGGLRANWRQKWRQTRRCRRRHPL